VTLKLAEIPYIIALSPLIAYVKGIIYAIQFKYGFCSIAGNVPPPKHIFNTKQVIIVMVEIFLSLKLNHIP
jgi:hypothetical protein